MNEEQEANKRIDNLHRWAILARLEAELDASPVNVARWRYCVRRYEAAVLQLVERETR